MPEDELSPAGEVTLNAAVVDDFVETLRLLHVSGDHGQALTRITTSATEVIKGCDVASLTLRDGDELVTRAPTGELATRADAIQYEEGEGPCLSAVENHGVVLSSDTTEDDRWPSFLGRASKELGVRAMLSCQLPAPGGPGTASLGGLNLYALRSHAFTDADVVFTALFTAHAAVVVAALRQEAQLREAIASRDIIGQAKGILMASGGITSDMAFGQLRSASQRLNVKLRDVAGEVVAKRSLGTTPLPERGE